MSLIPSLGRICTGVGAEVEFRDCLLGWVGGIAFWEPGRAGQVASGWSWAVAQDALSVIPYPRSLENTRIPLCFFFDAFFCIFPACDFSPRSLLCYTLQRRTSLVNPFSISPFVGASGVCLCLIFAGILRGPRAAIREKEEI